MAKKINKKQVDAVFGGKQKLSFESENIIISTDTNLKPDEEKEFYISKIYNGKDKFFLSFKTIDSIQDNIQSITLYNVNTGKDYPLTFEKVSEQGISFDYTRETIHTYEIKEGLENYVNTPDIHTYKLRVKAPKQSEIFDISLVEVLEYPQHKNRGGSYFEKFNYDEGYETVHKFFNSLGENTYNIELPTQIGYVKPIEESKELRRVAGCILLCTNDTDITLDLSNVDGGSAFSIVKIGNGAVRFSHTTGTFITTNNEITGNIGSSASIIVYNGKIIVNINNK
nr:MAG TPA: hypothetical protein [Herelleviridae sp.]